MNQPVAAHLPGLRLLTCFGTVFYVDEENGQLRHGDRRTSPENFCVTITDTIATLLFVSANDHSNIMGWRDGLWICIPHAISSISGDSCTFHIEKAGVGTIGLSSNGIFLCAEPDGSVTLSRAECNEWEQFRCYSEPPFPNFVRTGRSTFYVPNDQCVSAGAQTAFLKRTLRIPPFYVLAPSFSPYAGGTVALHLLCHFLNQVGFESYLSTASVTGTLFTPELTPDIAKAHFSQGRDPIAIYGEGYLDNRLLCSRIIRYLLNLPGQRWSNPSAADSFWRQRARRSEFILHYASEFRLPYLPSTPLFIPIVDEELFYPPNPDADRQGYLIYSHRTLVSTDMIPEWATPYTMIEMTNPRTPHELGMLYRRSRALIVFERTGAQIEALMCGCPVVAIPHGQFRAQPLLEQFGDLGVGWGSNEKEYYRAASTVSAFQSFYKAYAASFPIELVNRMHEAIVFFQS